MGDSVVGVMRRVAEHEARRMLTTELGVVTAVFPHADEGDTDNYQCSVQLRHKVLPDGQKLELRQVPIATPYVGLACIPNVGDLVLVQFVGGDVNQPIVTARLYNDADRPPANLKDEFLVMHKPTEGGSIRIDKDGKILVTSKSTENVLTVDDEAISFKNEKFSLVIDFKGENITLTSDKDLSLLASKGKVLIDAKELEIKSGSTIKIGAPSGKLSIEAQEAEVKASTTAKVEASAGLTLKGATIDLN